MGNAWNQSSKQSQSKVSWDRTHRPLPTNRPQTWYSLANFLKSKNDHKGARFCTHVTRLFGICIHVHNIDNCATCNCVQFVGVYVHHVESVLNRVVEVDSMQPCQNCSILVWYSIYSLRYRPSTSDPQVRNSRTLEPGPGTDQLANGRARPCNSNVHMWR